MRDALYVPEIEREERSLDAGVGLVQRLAQLEQEVSRLRYCAYHDALTGLPNRRLLRDRVTHAMLQPARQYKTFGLLLLDLNHFKTINDQLGHGAGDRLLQLTAERLRNCIRSCGTAYRYGGDEFIVMLPDVATRTQAQQVRDVMHRIRTQLSAPYMLDRHPVIIGVSIGAALLADGYQTCDEMIHAADAAMYRAKRRTQSGLCPDPAAAAEEWGERRAISYLTAS